MKLKQFFLSFSFGLCSIYKILYDVKFSSWSSCWFLFNRISLLSTFYLTYHFRFDQSTKEKILAFVLGSGLQLSSFAKVCPVIVFCFLFLNWSLIVLSFPVFLLKLLSTGVIIVLFWIVGFLSWNFFLTGCVFGRWWLYLCLKEWAVRYCMLKKLSHCCLNFWKDAVNIISRWTGHPRNCPKLKSRSCAFYWR